MPLAPSVLSVVLLVHHLFVSTISIIILIIAIVLLNHTIFNFLLLFGVLLDPALE